MTVQVEVSGSMLAGPQDSVEVYDFQRPATLARDQSRMLELAFETFARQWGTQLTAKVRVVSRASLETVFMQTYDEYAASLPATSAMVLCALEGVQARAVIQFSTSSALSWVGRMLGGSGALEPPERTFSPTEQAIVRRLMDDALEDLKYSLGGLLPMNIAVETIHYNSQFAQAATPADFMIVGIFTIRVGDRTTRATVAIPADALLPQLGQQHAEGPSAGATALLRSQLAAVPVGVSLRLEPAMVNPRIILTLAEGDLICLPHPQHRPLTIAIDGQPFAAAAVGANGSRLACVVVETQEAS